MINRRWGATLDQWKLFSGTLGLREHLLPVVSNLEAEISPNSSLKKIGKVPSFYNRKRLVTGISDWGNFEATVKQIKEWAAEKDYGICLIGRLIKGVDVDVKDPVLAAKIRDTIEDFLFDIGIFDPPTRTRADSSKFLIGLKVPNAPFDKDVIKCEQGMIEMLSNKQQFIVAGTHEDGCDYEWSNLENGFPEITRSQLEQLCTLLRDTYGVDPTPGSGLKELKNQFSIHDDPIYTALYDKGMIKSEGTSEGSFNIVCPFEHEHTMQDESDKDSSTTYFPAHTGGHAHSSIVCLHGHCQDRNTESFKRALGFTGAEDFEPLDDEDIIPPSAPQLALLEKKKTFRGAGSVSFCSSFADIKWLVKHLIPDKSIGCILGASAAGKSFVTFDLAAAIARGVVWQNSKTRKGRVLYICAEGAAMFKLRGAAYHKEHNILTDEEMPLSIYAAAPNLMDKDEVEVFIAAIKEQYGHEEIAMIIFDTYARCMVGDENSSKDTALMIRGMERVREALDTTLLIVHHTGKTAGMGARGHSSLWAAFDFEITVERLKEVNGIQLHQMSSGKSKDALKSLKTPFKLKKVVLGIDEDMDEITSCVVGELSEQERSLMDEGDTGKPMGENQAALIQLIATYHGNYQKWPKECALIEEVRRHFKELGKGPNSDMQKPFKIKGMIKSMCEHGKGLRKDRDDRVILTMIEPLTDENAVHDPLVSNDKEDHVFKSLD